MLREGSTAPDFALHTADGQLVSLSETLRGSHKKDGTLLGATIVARRAGEMIHEWIVALDRGLKVGDLANAIHIYPAYSTACMQAAAIRVEQLLSGTSGRIVRGLARSMR